MSLVAERCWFRGAGGALIHFDARDARGLRSLDPPGIVLTVHGLGEHLGKYGSWLDFVAEAGWHATAFDLRGHGHTPGRRGHFDFPDLVDDLADFVDVTRDRYPGLPVFVVGHSLGALVAIRYATTTETPAVAGLALSSPPIELVRVYPRWYRWGIQALDRIAPWAPIPRGTDPARLTRDPERVEAIRRDPLASRVISARGMLSTGAAIEAIGAGAGRLTLPLLVLVAEDDAITRPDSTLAWCRETGSTDVMAGKVAGAYHEILNDLGRESAWRRILAWCEARTGAVS
ncbi:MAG TPA: lysophospholipase [Gemmatimonadota bacterium]|nr:lysophospholipase [Gemmatimonadota bacterium]